MKILYLCTFYHRALLFRQQMDALNERGHYVRAFSSAQYGEGVAEKFKPIMDDKVAHYECWNKFDRIFFFPRQWKIERKLELAYDLKDFDLIHAHLLLSSGYSALRMKNKYGIPYVVSVRSTDLNGFIKLPYFRRLAINILKESSGVLFLSRSHKEELKARFLNDNEKNMLESKCVIIGNCLEPFWSNHISKPRITTPVLNDDIKILAVAKIQPVKNLPVAAMAAEELCARGYNATLTIIGENQDNTEYERIKKHKCVVFKPFMTKEELIREYATHDIFLLPSINETFGRVYLEAMTQGLPVLYTKGQGFDQIFKEGEVGYSIPSDNPKEIADRIEDILNNYLTISRNCIEGSALFSEEIIMDNLEKFYLDSLQRK